MDHWVYILESAFAPHTTIVEVRRKLAQIVDESDILQQHHGKTDAGEQAFFFKIADRAAAVFNSSSSTSKTGWLTYQGVPPDVRKLDAGMPSAPAKEGIMKFLPWILGLIALLILVLLLKNCNSHKDQAVTSAPVTPAPAAAPAAPTTPAVAVEKVTLPGGQVVELAPNTLNYQLQAFLASGEAAPRRFTFDKLNFATNSADLDVDAQTTVNALAAILKAYPNTRVRLEGFTDERGTPLDNVKLSDKRANAVAQALTAQGIDHGRISAFGKGESQPDATNATSAGRAENRRTELVVVHK